MLTRNGIVRVTLVGILGLATLGSTLALQQRGDDYAFFDELIELRHIIDKRFVEAPDMEKIRLGAIKGMVEALNDPYSVYVPASERKAFTKQLTGEYVGIGAQVNVQDGWLTIVTPLEDAPAFKAGVMPDDRVTSIDGTSTQNMVVDKCVELLTGEPGTKVVIEIERKGEKKTIEIIREKIKTRSVKGYHRDPADPNRWEHLIDPASGIAYIRMTQFTPKVSEEVAAALMASGAGTGSLKGLVLDLRFNPGGLLGEAVSIADMFLREGVIVSTKGRAIPEQVARARTPGTLGEFPIVVLLNGQSASASEVLAGALVENNRAIVLGSRSFGKGSVQGLIEVPGGNGSEIKLTEQGYYLPSGRSITRKDDSAQWGVDPTPGFYVPMTDQEVGAMLEVRRKEEIMRVTPDTHQDQHAKPEQWNDPAWIEATLKDKQLAAAIKALQAKLATGEWTPATDVAQATATLAVDELRRIRELRERLLRELERTDKREAALEAGAGDAASRAKVDLWDDAIELTGGVLEIRDKDGKVVMTFDITGPSLERWLFDADLKKRE